MKKFMRVCAIMALIFLALGFALGAVGSRMAGRSTISQVVETATRGRIHLNMGSWWNWGVTAGDNFFRGLFGGDDVSYDIGDVSMFDSDHEILNGKVEKYCPGSDVHNLMIEVGGCQFETKSSDDAFIYLEVKNANKFQGYVEDGTLYIKTTAEAVNWSKVNDCKITLYLPDGYRFDEVDIELGAGEMKLKRLYAGEASLNVGAGQITVDGIQSQEVKITIGAGDVKLEGMEITELEAEVGLGEFEADGSINGSAQVKCSMGNVEMKLNGEEKAFNYRLEGSMGNIDLGKKNYSGFSNEVVLDNGADKEMQVECSMGNISIRFRD